MGEYHIALYCVSFSRSNTINKLCIIIMTECHHQNNCKMTTKYVYTGNIILISQASGVLFFGSEECWLFVDYYKNEPVSQKFSQEPKMMVGLVETIWCMIGWKQRPQQRKTNEQINQEIQLNLFTFFEKKTNLIAEKQQSTRAFLWLNTKQQTRQCVIEEISTNVDCICNYNKLMSLENNKGDKREAEQTQKQIQ